MDNSASHTEVLQSWLEQLQTNSGTGFEDARRAVINHASDRLEQLAHKMLAGYPRLRRWEQTGDVLQNALLRLHRSLSTIQPETVRQFYGLAAAQIRRELIDLTRHHFGPEGAAAKHHTDGANESRAVDWHVPAEASSEPTSLAEWTEFHEAVQCLPAAEREVFDLYWYEGLDQKRIASLLKVTDQTVKNRWRSAKLLLQEMLSDDDHRNREEENVA